MRLRYNESVVNGNLWPLVSLSPKCIGSANGRLKASVEPPGDAAGARTASDLRFARIVTLARSVPAATRCYP